MKPMDWLCGPTEELTQERFGTVGYRYGGRTLSLSHVDELAADFGMLCDRVELRRLTGDQTERPGPIIDNLEDVDDAALERLVLAGWVDPAPWPLVQFRFGEHQIGELVIEPHRIDELIMSLRSEALKKGETDFDARLEARESEVSTGLRDLLSTSNRRIAETDRRRRFAWHRKFQGLVALEFLGLVGIFAWFTVATRPAVPTMVIAALALAVVGGSIRRWLGSHTGRYFQTWQAGPTAVDLTRRIAWRQARWNDRRDVKVGAVLGIIGALAGLVVGALAPWSR